MKKSIRDKAQVIPFMPRTKRSPIRCVAVHKFYEQRIGDGEIMDYGTCSEYGKIVIALNSGNFEVIADIDSQRFQNHASFNLCNCRDKLNSKALDYLKL